MDIPITITCHFISNNWELHCVLDTVHVEVAYTAENLSIELTGVTDKIVWYANNIVAA